MVVLLILCVLLAMLSLYVLLVLLILLVNKFDYVSSVGPVISVDSAGQAKTNNNRTKTIIMTFDKGNDAWPIFFPQGSVCLVESVGSVVVLLEIFVFVGSVCSDDSVGSVVASQEIIPGPEQPRENV